MSVFELSGTSITELQRVNFAGLGILERGDLQRLLRDHVEVISPGTLIISEEFSSWDRSDRRIDLLGVDQQERLVIIELKRTTDDSLADLQALRYAAMVSQMTFEEAVETYGRYLAERQREVDPRTSLLEFLGWGDASEGRFGEDVRIVLAAADFSPEVTSTVLWLNQRELDIVCMRLQPFRLDSRILLNVEQIIPLPEAADYQIQIRQKQREARTAVEQSADWTRYDVKTGDGAHRSLSKREAIYKIVAYLVGKGIKPEAVETAAGKPIFESVEGAVGGEGFRAELSRLHPKDGSILKRYFCHDNQLLLVDGKTYAVTTQWTKATMEAAIEGLIRSFASLGIGYNVSSGAMT